MASVGHAHLILTLAYTYLEFSLVILGDDAVGYYKYGNNTTLEWRWMGNVMDTLHLLFFCAGKGFAHVLIQLFYTNFYTNLDKLLVQLYHMH